MHRFLKVLAFIGCCGLAPQLVVAQYSHASWKDVVAHCEEAYLKSDSARLVAEQVLLYQRCTGGWPKNIDMARPLTKSEREAVKAMKSKRNDSTTDNGATTQQMDFLAKMYQATGKKVYREAVRRGIDYLLSGQYDNGGWPQFWPVQRAYQPHITYNDNAMYNTMTLLETIIHGEAPYCGDIADEAMLSRLKMSYKKGIECILRTQIVVNGEPTVWCQQHDHVTFAPSKARAYELPSYCSQESAYLVEMLLRQPDPSDSIKRAIHGAMKWFDANKIKGYKVVRVGKKGDPDRNTFIMADSTAKPMWARYYDLENCQPFFCDRDGVPRKNLEEIGLERRNGYSWYNTKGGDLYKLYRIWGAKYDPEHTLRLKYR